MQQTVELVPVGYKDLDDFVKRLQKAFTYATRSDFPDFLGNIPPQRDVDEALDGENAEALSIVHEGKDIGGAVITGGEVRKTLEFLFIDPDKQNLRLGQAAWQAIEARYPDARTWELVTPYHEKRNIHFYVNKCGFAITEYYNDRHPDPNFPADEGGDYPGEDGGLFKFVKTVG